MARLAFPPFLRVFKDNGDVCTDATATWYDAGTTTLVDSYPTAADADANTNPNTNPVTANALGIFPAMWLADASEYKIVIAGTGVTTKTVDDVYSTASLDQLSGDRRYLGLAGGAAYTTTGSSNAYVVSTGLSTSSLSTYETLLIKPNFTNTGPATLNVDSIGAKNITRSGVALRAGELQSGQIYQVSYDGTEFELLSASQALAVASNPNLIINGDIAVNLDGPSTSADDTYALTLWNILTQTGTVAVTRQSAQENGQPFNGRITQSQASAQRFGFEQIIERGDCQDLRGSSVTFSGRVRLSASANVRIAILEWTGTADSVTSDVVNDWTSSTYTAGNFFNSTTLNILGVSSSIALTANTWTDLTALTASVGSSANNLIVICWTEATQAQNVTLDFGRMKLEPGSAATRFVPDRKLDTLRKVSRFFQKSFSETTVPAQNVGIGTGEFRFPAQQGGANTNRMGKILYPFGPMIASPTITLFNPAAANAQARDISAAADCSATSALSTDENGVLITLTGNASTVVASTLGIHWRADARL